MIKLREGRDAICNLCGESVEVKRRADIVTLDIHTNANKEHCRNSGSSKNHNKEHYEQLDALEKSKQ